MIHLHDAQTQIQNASISETTATDRAPGVVRQLGQRMLRWVEANPPAVMGFTERGMQATDRHIEQKGLVDSSLPGPVAPIPAQRTEDTPHDVSEPPAESAA